MVATLPKSQTKNLLDKLESKLREKMDEDSVAYHRAFNVVALDHLGLDPDNGQMSDGPKDRGVDFWEVNSDQTTIFQFKSHDYTESFNPEFEIEPNHLNDLRDIRDLLENLDAPLTEANKSVKELLTQVRDAVHEIRILNDGLSNAKDSEELQNYIVQIIFVALAKCMNKQAQEEYTNICSFNCFSYDGVRIVVQHSRYLIGDLLEEIWKSGNIVWKDKSGKSKDKIIIRVAGGEKAYIGHGNWRVFFGKAADLVSAFRVLGYQIFEPNVRCELKTSKINKAIRKAVETATGRRNFKHYNNGITITCDTFTNPSSNKPSFTITHPGVINGLQTVKSLYDAYMAMDPSDKTAFDDQCEVLIRLQSKKKNNDLNALIRATNNQNPMQPRNLRSNEPEQISYQRSFGDLGWFYERKEQEWNAFGKNDRAWPQLQGKRKNYFRSSGTGYKRVDNLAIAQSYLAFIGYTTEALNKKKVIFEDDMYEIIFRRRVQKHGEFYNLNFLRNRKAILADSAEGGPTPDALLCSLLCKEAAKYFSIDLKKARESAVKRLDLKGKTPEEINQVIYGDKKYVSEHIVCGTGFLFVEMVGFVLFKSFGPKTFDACKKLLRNFSMKVAFEDYDFETAKDHIEKKSYDNGDILILLWLMYVDIISGLPDDPVWFSQWKLEGNRARFHYSEMMRDRILARVGDFEGVVNKGNRLIKHWSEGFDKEKSIFGFVQKSLS